MAETVSVVFSFRNEEQVLPELVRRTVAALSGCSPDYELVFVNDSSTDGSLRILKSLRERDHRIKIANMSRRFGVYECLMAGLALARGDAVIYLESDLQDPPELIPRLLEEWRRGSDVVHTVRTRRRGETRFRLWVTRLAYRALAFSSEVPLQVEAGDYKLLSRRAVKRLAQMRETDPYFRGLAVWVGFRQSAVEYEREARAGGRSKRGLLTAAPWQVFVSGLTSFSSLPLYAVAIAGALAAALALALAAGGAAACALGTRPGSAFWLAVLILGCWSSSLAALGAVAIYVARIYKDVRGRPLYIVSDTIGFDPP